MRVAMVSEHASPLAVMGGVDAGGQNVHVAALALSMARRGIEVVVYTRRDSPELPNRVMMAPRLTVEHIDAGPPRVIPKDDIYPHIDQLAAGLRSAWSRRRPDIVHAHFWMSGLAALTAAHPLDLPVVQTFHALGAVKRRHQAGKDTSPPQRLDDEASIIRRADHIVATSTDEVLELLRLGALRRRISVIPCGVDLELFRPGGAASPRDDRKQRLVVVSRLVERKGIGDVVAALPELPNTELIIAGGPPAAEIATDPEGRRLQQIAHRLRVDDRVILAGGLSREEVPALLRSADVAVCVPWYEPFGIVPVEAMACGVPVIGSAVGGLLDTVVDGVTGVHVAPRDPVAIASAARVLLADPELRRRLGRAGAQRAALRYGHDHVAEASVAVYRRLIRSAEPQVAWATP